MQQFVVYSWSIGIANADTFFATVSSTRYLFLYNAKVLYSVAEPTAVLLPYRARVAWRVGRAHRTRHRSHSQRPDGPCHVTRSDRPDSFTPSLAVWHPRRGPCAVGPRALRIPASTLKSPLRSTPRILLYQKGK